MKSYYRLMLGKKSAHAEECFGGNFIGTDFGIAQDLTQKLTDEWRAFNKTFIPVFLAGHPGKSRVVAGLACGALWTVSKGIKNGDIVLCPDGALSRRCDRRRRRFRLGLCLSASADARELDRQRLGGCRRLRETLGVQDLSEQLQAVDQARSGA